MFNDQQNDQAQANTDMDTVAQEIGAPAPTLTLSGAPAPPPSGAPVSSAPPADPATTTEPAAAPEPPQITTNHPAPTPQEAHKIIVDSSLDAIKHDALEQLSPLVNKLDQPPEEKYKTLMMMIQASDNQDLVKDAYQAANAIADEKTKAEALLGIINEINYFTQQKQ